MENEVECREAMQGAHGFGHTTSGQLKIVRLFSPPIVPKELVSITEPLKYCLEICKLDEKDENKKKLLWSKKEVHSQVPYKPSEQDFAKLVSGDGMLFWKGGYERQVQIIQFDLNNEELGLLVPPPVEDLSFSNMSLGHGFQGQLSLSLSTPPSKDEKCFRLHIWVLQRNEGGGFWHKLLNIPMEDSSISRYVPLSFFHGRGDGAVNLLFQRNEEEIVQIIPGGVETVSGTIVSSFSFSESSFSIAMESCKFKATPLAAQTYIILEHNNQKREREEEEHKKKKWDCSRLSFADDFD